MKKLLLFFALVTVAGLLAGDTTPKQNPAAQESTFRRVEVPGKAGYWQLDAADDIAIRFGGDLTMRHESYNRAAIAPDGGMHGRDVQYLRFHTRLWSTILFGEDVALNLRLANRTQYYTSNIGDPNNREDGTWRFPDELILDLANLQWQNAFGQEELTITLGRQNLRFGNGMIVIEGTPFDQGRSTYFDALRINWKDDTDDVNLLVMYNTAKDRWTVLNDRNRTLRVGDIFTLGAYWTHTFHPALAIDTYYFFDDIDDSHPEEAQRLFPADMNWSVHTAGARIFGQLHPRFEYSFEGAFQAGRDSQGNHLDARMFDGNLKFHLRTKEDGQPLYINLAYTHFSGDRSSTGKNEGWLPIWDSWPIWGENIFPVTYNSYWNNLNMYHVEAGFAPTAKLSFRFRSAALYAVHDNNRTGGGNRYGLLNSFFAKYAYSPNLSFSLELSKMHAGNYYGDGRDPQWAQLQAIWTF